MFICWWCVVDCNNEVQKELLRRYQARLNSLSVRLKYNGIFGCDLALKGWWLKNSGMSENTEKSGKSEEFRNSESTGIYRSEAPSGAAPEAEFPGLE